MNDVENETYDSYAPDRNYITIFIIMGNSMNQRTMRRAREHVFNRLIQYIRLIRHRWFSLLKQIIVVLLERTVVVRALHMQRKVMTIFRKRAIHFFCVPLDGVIRYSFAEIEYSWNVPSV